MELRKEVRTMANIVVCAKCTARTCIGCKVDWIDYKRPFGALVKGVTV